MALAGIVLVFAAFACGGGGHSDNKTYAPTVVSITHLDLKNTVTVADAINPPTAFVNQYSATVATVNGKPITGKSLIAEEIFEEVGRSNQDPELATQVQTKPRAVDPLESVIDDELLRQAVERLGLLPSHEEAIAYTRSKNRFFSTRSRRQQTLTSLLQPYARKATPPATGPQTKRPSRTSARCWVLRSFALRYAPSTAPRHRRHLRGF